MAKRRTRKVKKVAPGGEDKALLFQAHQFDDERFARATRGAYDTFDQRDRSLGGIASRKLGESVEYLKELLLDREEDVLEDNN